MAKQGTIKSIIEVFISNIFTVIAGIVVGFIIPKVLSVDGYGYYKTFTLYITYVGFFSLGIIDGIVLEFGGHDYELYDKGFFRSVFRWYLVIHFLWISVLLLLSILWHDSNYSYIIMMIAIYMLFFNTVGYFQQISQITQRFKEYSIAKAIQSVMKILGGLIFCILSLVKKENGYLWIYKEIIFGRADSFTSTKPNVIHYSKIGFPLLFANLCSTLILTLDRQFVNLLFTNAEYAIYAFAYNLLSLITVATSAISTVLYPVMKRLDESSLCKGYDYLIGTLCAFVYGTITVYFPLCAIIQRFLPKYIGSLMIFRVIFPGLSISSTITVIMHNYYKTLGDNLSYFKKSILILLLSALANGIAYTIFKSTISISAASIVTMIIWYIYIEQYFVKRYEYNRWNNLIYMLLMMASFYAVTSISSLLISGFLYFIIFIVVTYIMQRKNIHFAKSILGK